MQCLTALVMCVMSFYQYVIPTGSIRGILLFKKFCTDLLVIFKIRRNTIGKRLLWKNIRVCWMSLRFRMMTGFCLKSWSDIQCLTALVMHGWVFTNI